MAGLVGFMSLPILAQVLPTKSLLLAGLHSAFLFFNTVIRCSSAMASMVEELTQNPDLQKLLKEAKGVRL